MSSTEGKPTTIQSLNELIAALLEEPIENYAEIVRSINLPPSAFESFCSWSSETYTRNCIIGNEKFELILICWEKGQGTPIHDHAGEECWVKIVQGDIKETIYKVNEQGELKVIKSTESKAGNISYMVDFMGVHRLENLNNERGMTLHLYANPIRTCQSFDESTRKFVRRELTYDTVSEMMTEIK